jgi:hypothetical protein
MWSVLRLLILGMVSFWSGSSLRSSALVLFLFFSFAAAEAEVEAYILLQILFHFFLSSLLGLDLCFIYPSVHYGLLHARTLSRLFEILLVGHSLPLQTLPCSFQFFSARVCSLYAIYYVYWPIVLAFLPPTYLCYQPTPGTIFGFRPLFYSPERCDLLVPFEVFSLHTFRVHLRLRFFLVVFPFFLP